MSTFADWLRYDNYLDINPFLEALTEIRNVYHGYGVDILKDAGSLPFVPLQFLLQVTSQLPKEPNLMVPNKKACDMLKGAVAAGPSLVFIRHQKAKVTRIYLPNMTTQAPAKVVGYDANILYPSTMPSTCPVVEEWFCITTITKPPLKPSSKNLSNHQSYQ